MATAQKISTSKFKNICFIGLNKVEFHPENGEVLFADSWLDIIDDQLRRNLMLAFFAPRDLNGEPMDPATVLAGKDEEIGPEFMQQFKNIALFDMCRAAKAPPNTVYVIMVADIIFHWDANDTYIQPTTQETWAQDLQLLFKHYPRTTSKHVFTDWDVTAAAEMDGVEFARLVEAPLDMGMWLNKPTLQEKFGSYALFAGLLAATACGGILYMQQKDIDAARARTAAISRSSNLGADARSLLQSVSNIEGFMRYRGLFSVIFKDVGLAIDDSNFKATDFVVENPRPQEAPDTLIATIRAPLDIYPDFDTQEPVAKALLRDSVTITAVRKPPGGSSARQYALEALIPLEPVARELREYQALSRTSGIDLLPDKDKPAKHDAAPKPEARTPNK